MIAVDTNILVYAHRADSTWHDRAAVRIREVAESAAPWLIPLPCVHEFMAIVTHPRIFAQPTPLAGAIDQVDAWLESPSLVLQGESPRHWHTLRALLKASRVSGPAIHDARIAAICIEHGVTELWSADRDFSRFASVRVVNPLIGD